MGPERPSEPVLFMANHPVMVRTFAGIRELSSESGNLVVACDALYSRILEKSGVEVIGIDSPDKTFWSDKLVYRARTRLTRILGEYLHAYDNAYKDIDAVEAMVDALRSGHDLFVTASGVSDPDAKWRSGIGRVAIEVKDDPVRAGFVYIPNSFMKKNRIEYGPLVGSLLPQKGQLRSHEVALQLQAEYRKRLFQDK